MPRARNWMNVGDLPTREEAISKLFAAFTPPIRTKVVKTREALYSVNAEDLYSLLDKPVVRASQMDGVAVKSERFAGGLPDASGWQQGVDWIRADTGDDFDDAFDAVIAVENVEFLEGGGLRFSESLEEVGPNTNVSPKGSSIKVGDPLVPAHTRLLPIDLAAIAMGGVSVISVYEPPIVGFIPTGSELVPLGTLPERGQTVDSNSLLAEGMIAEMGAVPKIYPITRDDKEQIQKAVSLALSECDIVVLCAGTSKGSEDYCARVIGEMGTLFCNGVMSAPGRPIALGLIDGKPIVNVAGPPAGCFNGLHWCVRRLIWSFFESDPPAPRTVKAAFEEGVPAAGPGFEAFIRLTLEKTAEGYVAKRMSRQAPSSAEIRSEGLYITNPNPKETEGIKAADVELLR